MTQEAFINILVAEDNDLSREMMSGVLRTQGYRVYGAINAESAIKVVEDRDIDLALVDINMSPTGGFEFIKYLIVKGLTIPVVVITGDDSSHVLMEATSLGVRRVLQKPVEPDRLVQTVERLLKQRGLNPKPLAVVARETRYSPDEIMQKAIALAGRNARSRHGGPYGAIVADADGKILGEGVNGISSRVDPTAHAEVMAIRQASERLGRADLSDCVLYCSGEPTMMGKALIASVGIGKVYYGLSNDEARTVPKPRREAEYIPMQQEQARAMFREWQAQKEKVTD